MSPTPLFLITLLVAIALVVAGIATVGFWPAITMLAVASTFGVFVMLVGVSRL